MNVLRTFTLIGFPLLLAGCCDPIGTSIAKSPEPGAILRVEMRRARRDFNTDLRQARQEFRRRANEARMELRKSMRERRDFWRDYR